MNEINYDVAIVGGGPAGATAALYLARMNFRVCVIEKTIFPREKLCGEFLSKEVLQIIEELNLSEGFLSLHPNPLTSFRLCLEDSRSFTTKLPFTAYGLKRGAFDAFLLDNARMAGAEIIQPATVRSIQKTGSEYELVLQGEGGIKHLTARQVISAHGKSLSLDKTLQRSYRNSQSRLNGIKFHIHKKYLPNVPEHEIQLYTGHNMYCGVNIVNDNTVTLCFLENRSSDDVPPRGRITELMKVNAQFARAVSTDFESMLSSFPIYGTGDIYFGKKNIVEDGIFMVGDAAGVIAPLAGDGMGMAMESAKIIAFVLDEGRKKNLDRAVLSRLYTSRWRSSFQYRLRIAKEIQYMLFSRLWKKVCGRALAVFPSVLTRAIELTRR